MKIGIRNKENEGLLKLAVGICLLYALVRAGEFAYSRIPPYSPDTCLSTNIPMVSIRVKENHIIEGYSNIEMSVLTFKEEMLASFVELRDPNLKQMECPR